MKISIEHFKQAPKGLYDGFVLSVYGQLPEDVKSWVEYHKFEVDYLDAYANIIVDKDPYDVFVMPDTKYDYLDGFSPNLNKNLHIGHMSNLVYAKAFKKMGVARLTVSILGNTLEGTVSNDVGLANFHILINNVGYTVDMLHFASMMKLEDDAILMDGEDEYEGTKVFVIKTPYSEKYDDVPHDLVVGKKSDGTTTYFYQDVALAQKLNTSTMYLTGSEQKEHFESLSRMFPGVQHVGLGLVKANGKKMASRTGNVIYLDDVMEMLVKEFGTWDLAYNVFAGYILKTAPHVEKNIDLDTVSNPKLSPGLYLSYTLARLKSAGVNIQDEGGRFDSYALQFKYMKAKLSEMPNWLFAELIEHAKYINNLYASHTIRGNDDNMKMFEIMGSDLLKGMKKLGLFDIDVVPQKDFNSEI